MSNSELILNCYLKALNGDSEGARRELLNSPEACTSEIGLELLARIDTDLGNYDEALACWCKLQSLYPANKKALRSLERLFIFVELQRTIYNREFWQKHINTITDLAKKLWRWVLKNWRYLRYLILFAEVVCLVVLIIKIFL